MPIKRPNFSQSKEKNVYKYIRIKKKKEVGISWKESGKKIALRRRDPTKLGPLLPPFMQRKSRERVSGEDSVSEISNKVADTRATSEIRLSGKTDITSLEDKPPDFTSPCRHTSSTSTTHDDSNFAQNIAEESHVPCYDECATNVLKCDELPSRKTRSFAEIADGEPYDSFQLRDADYQECEELEVEEDFDTDEIDRHWTTKKIELSPCGSFLSMIEDEKEEDHANTTDPYLSHQLYIPYSSMPKPRFFSASGKDVEYVSSYLPSRSRSPVRKILSGKFDLETALRDRKKREEMIEVDEYLRESINRISQSLRQLSKDNPDEETLISFVVLQAVCEQVTLTMTHTKLDIDVHTFVPTAVVWALRDLQLFNGNTLKEEHFGILKDFGIIGPKSKFDIIGKADGLGMRRALSDVYRIPFGHNAYAFIHRRLPWPYVAPAHERGHMKLYPNIRERIDDKIPEAKGQVSTAYVPDLVCYHFKDVFEKTYMAYKRRSKYLSTPSKWKTQHAKNFYIQLVSFT